MTSPSSKLAANITVHSVLPDGRRVIHEDGASKWYVENIVEGTRSQVSLDEAVYVAIQGSVKLGVTGGEEFDSHIHRALESRKNL